VQEENFIICIVLIGSIIAHLLLNLWHTSEVNRINAEFFQRRSEREEKHEQRIKEINAEHEQRIEEIEKKYRAR